MTIKKFEKNRVGFRSALAAIASEIYMKQKSRID